MDRDFSFVFAAGTTWEEIGLAINGLGIAELLDFTPAETFRGGNVPAGKYSLLLRALFQSTDHTLREEELAAWSAQIIAALQKLGGTQRT